MTKPGAGENMDKDAKVVIGLIGAFGIGVLVGFYVIPRPDDEDYRPIYVMTCEELLE